jgi:hypothetical protein
VSLHQSHSLRILTFVVVIVVALAGACSPSGGLGQVPTAVPTPSEAPSPSAPDVTPAPSPSASPSTGPGATPAPSQPVDTTIVRAYFYLGGEPDAAGLVPVLREVPETRAVATAAMNALLEGPSEAEAGERTITSAIPAGSRLLGVTVTDGVATVNLSREFESGGGSQAMFVRLAQVVYTLTQFPTVDAVRFQVEGTTVTVFSAEGIVLDGPVGRDDFLDQLPAIWVDRPAYGASLGNPGRIAGSANVFEASFLITLLDADGSVIREVPAMATCGTGCRGTFDVSVPYDVPEAGWGILRVWAGSAKDGSPVHVREYPVWLTPAA